MLDVVTLVILAGVFAAVAYSLWTRERPDPLVRKTVVVHLKDGATIKGILLAKRSDEWAIQEASLVSGQQQHMLGGVQHIPASNISFAQELAPDDPTKVA